MTPEELAAKQRRELLRRERAVQRELVATYGEAIKRTRADIAALQALISELPAGRDRARLLERQARFQRILDGTRDQLAAYVRSAVPAITRLQREHAQTALDHTFEQIALALGEGPTVEFRPPNAQVVARLIGNAADGEPLGDLLHEIAGAQLTAAKRELLVGVTLGHHPRDIARRFADTTNVTRARSLTVMRTESLRAYRQTTLETFRTNPSVKGWVWMAALDTRTCPVCWAMHGTEHSLDESLDSHPNCRCAMSPVTVSWADLGFPGLPDTSPSIQTGVDAFARLSAADKRRVLGPTKAEAYARGDLALPDLVRRTRHARWGKGLRTASLAEATAAASR